MSALSAMSRTAARAIDFSPRKIGASPCPCGKRACSAEPGEGSRTEKVEGKGSLSPCGLPVFKTPMAGALLGAGLAAGLVWFVGALGFGSLPAALAGSAREVVCRDRRIVAQAGRHTAQLEAAFAKLCGS